MSRRVGSPDHGPSAFRRSDIPKVRGPKDTACVCWAVPAIAEVQRMSWPEWGPTPSLSAQYAIEPAAPRPSRTSLSFVLSKHRRRQPCI